MVFILALVFVAGCASSASSLMVTQAKETPEYPAVVQIEIHQRRKVINCTASFIRPDTLLTAAHCFDAPSGNDVLLGEFKTSRYTSHPAFSRILPGFASSSDMPRDLALVYFSQPISQNLLVVSTQKPQAGDPVTLVGYGSTSVERYVGVGTKRQGASQVLSRDRGLVSILGYLGEEYSTPTPFSAAGEGDSGGPLLDSRNGTILGVLSSVGVDSSYPGLGMAYYADLNDPENVNFIKDSLKH